MDRKKPDLVIFDWDNTLVSSWAVIHGAMQETLVAMGHAPWTMEETMARTRLSMRDSFPKLFAERWQEAGDIFYRAYDALHLQKMQPCSGAAEFLAFLSAQAIPMAVVSNKRQDYLQAEITHIGWGPHFSAIVGAGAAAADKPDRACFAHLQQILASRNPDQAYKNIVMIGDTDVDMRFAHNIGAQAIMINDISSAGEVSISDISIEKYKDLSELQQSWQ